MAKKKLKRVIELMPLKGVGPLTIGMLRKEVLGVLRAIPDALPIRTNATSDECFGSSFTINYDGNDKVTYFRVSCPISSNIKYQYQGVDLFETPAATLLRQIAQGREPDQELSNNTVTVLSELGLGLYLPSTEYDYFGDHRRKIYACVEMGGEAYLSLLRLSSWENPFSHFWSDRTQPKRSCAKQVKVLREINADLALDETGDVKRVQFLSDSLKLSLQDQHLAVISDLPSIEALWLGGNSEITSTCLPHLRGLRQLRAIDLMATAVDDRILSGLKNWPDLELLSLPEGISAVGLSKLKIGRKLFELRLDLTEEMEAGLHYLSDVKSLRILHLSRNLTDNGLKLLRDCPQLRKLSAYGARISKRAIQTLRRVNPELVLYN